MNIEVILTENDAKLGKRGEIVKVSQGFANNFLLPHGKAKLATPDNLKSFKAEKEKQAKEEERLLEAAKLKAEKIQGVSLTLEVSVGEAEKMFGSVTSHEITEALKNKGIVIEKKELHLEHPIKQLGNFQIPVKLHPEVTASLKLWVVKKK